MSRFLALFFVLLITIPLSSRAEKAGIPVTDSEIFSRSINAKFINFVLYPDGTYERRASFYPSNGKKHWATTQGTWAKTSDGRFCLKRQSFWFHDPRSKNLFLEGTCYRFYRSAKGVIRVDMRHVNGAGADRPIKLATANDGFHFPSIKALKASGAKKISPSVFLKSIAGRNFSVTQWLGRKNFVPARKTVFTLSNSSNKTVATNRRGKTVPAILMAKGQSLCTEFTFKKLWAKGCGTIWRSPANTIYIVSDKSGFAYMGGHIH